MGLDSIQFPWFPAEPTENADHWIQFIHALCETAKEKKRVTAKAQESFENEKFAMRVWLIGLGLIGKEYGQIRKLLAANLSGDSSWRFGKPEHTSVATSQETDTGADVGEESPVEADAPADEPAVEEAPVEEAGTDD
jgi:hypothetical protein